MQTVAATNSENRWVPIKAFCDRVGVPLRTGRYWVSIGRVKIKPKEKPKEHVYVDWFSWNEAKK